MKCIANVIIRKRFRPLCTNSDYEEIFLSGKNNFISLFILINCQLCEWSLDKAEYNLIKYLLHILPKLQQDIGHKPTVVD